jgi:transposase-like protein
MYVKVSGEMLCLWRAVDHEGEILESFVTKTRDKKAALAFMKKALKRHGSPEAFALERHLTDRQTYKERCSAASAECQSLAS